MEVVIDSAPVRSFLDDKNIKWRNGKPNFDKVNALYMKEKTRSHKEDSLEKITENLVKTWEVESTHKSDPEDWGTIVKDGSYFLQVNGGPKKTLEDNLERGNYNMLLEDCMFYDAKMESFSSSHSLFKTAFPDGFAWEVLDVLSGPPTVSFTWRHWARWTGPYKEQKPTGEDIELFGSSVAEVTDDLKIKNVKVFYDPHPMMAKLSGFKGSGKGCPVSHNGPSKGPTSTRPSNGSRTNGNGPSNGARTGSRTNGNGSVSKSLFKK